MLLLKCSPCDLYESNLAFVCSLQNKNLFQYQPQRRIIPYTESKLWIWWWSSGEARQEKVIIIFCPVLNDSPLFFLIQ